MTAVDFHAGRIRRPLDRLPPGGIVMVYAAMGGFLGMIGPFGSYLNDGGPATRVAYWTGTSLLSCVAFDLLLRLIGSRAGGVPRWVLVPMAVILATLPLSFATHALAIIIWPQLARIGWLEWYGQALLPSALYVAFKALLPEARSTPRAGIQPLRLGHDVLCLQMEDHYVRVHGSNGSRLVLASLGRAVAELNGVDGIQVHRSWWVARDAVESLVEDGRNIRLRLRNGLEVPVGRTKIAALRSAGWL